MPSPAWGHSSPAEPSFVNIVVEMAPGKCRAYSSPLKTRRLLKKYSQTVPIYEIQCCRFGSSLNRTKTHVNRTFFEPILSRKIVFFLNYLNDFNTRARRVSCQKLEIFSSLGKFRAELTSLHHYRFGVI